MTHLGGADNRRIRIRLSGDQPQDLQALRRWLGLEEWFTEAEAQYGLRVVFRERDGTQQPTGPDGPPMGGVVTEIVLMVASGVLTPVFDDLYRRAKTSVQAFATNLSSSRHSIDAEVTAEDASDDVARDPSDAPSGDATDGATGNGSGGAHGDGGPATPDGGRPPDGTAPAAGSGTGAGTGSGTGAHHDAAPGAGPHDSGEAEGIG
jgi:hypothetical protein